MTGLWGCVAVAMLTGLPVIASERCTCDLVGEVGQWCDVHQRGFVGPVEIESKWLFEAVDAHGHEVDPDSFDCPECRKALASDGFCSEHRIGFVGGLAYFSRLTHVLAEGRKRAPAAIACPACEANARSYRWCDLCRRGTIGSIGFADRDRWEVAVREIELLKRAVAASKRCRHCAVALITGTRCPVCGIVDQGGEPVRPVPE